MIYSLPKFTDLVFHDWKPIKRSDITITTCAQPLYVKTKLDEMQYKSLQRFIKHKSLKCLKSHFAVVWGTVLSDETGLVFLYCWFSTVWRFWRGVTNLSWVGSEVITNESYKGFSISPEVEGQLWAWCAEPHPGAGEPDADESRSNTASLWCPGGGNPDPSPSRNSCVGCILSPLPSH